MIARTPVRRTDDNPLEPEKKVGRRVIRAGQTVKITGQRGAMFTVKGFRGDEVHVYGGRPGHGQHRTFTVDRIGTRPRAQGRR